MKNVLEYRGVAVVETDEGPMGYPEGSWILSKSPAGWHVCYTGEAGTVQPYSGTEGLASRDAAWQELCGFIDDDLMHVAAMDKAQDFVPEVMNHVVSKDLKAGGYKLWAPVDIVKAEISIELLMKLHNGLPADDALRVALQDELREQTRRNSDLAGLMTDQSGNLKYDEARAVAAAQRRKIQRYVKAVQDHLDKLSDDLRFVLGVEAEERIATAEMSDAGVPLVELEPLSAAARALTAVEMPLQEALNVLAGQAHSADVNRAEAAMVLVEREEIRRIAS